jgi:pilus assembly protein Flp/PilA
MSALIFNWSMKLRGLVNGEEGQDLVEYALLISLVSLAAVAGIGTVATAISAEFSTVAASI